MHDKYDAERGEWKADFSKGAALHRRYVIFAYPIFPENDERPDETKTLENFAMHTK